MATRPGGGTPTYPEFAVDDVQDPTSLKWNVQEPSPEVKSTGWRRLERPPRFWFNWLHRLTNLWIQWFDQEVETAKTNITNLTSSLSSLSSTTSASISALGTAIATHDHDGVDDVRINPTDLSGVSVGDFIMTFTGFNGNLNKPLRCVYKLYEDDWDGTEFASNPVVEIRTTRLNGTASATVTSFVTGQKMVLTLDAQLTAGSSTVVTVGASSTAGIPFNTDHATTMADIVTAVNALSEVFDCRIGDSVLELDIVRTSGDVASSSAVTTGGSPSVTWTLSAPYSLVPTSIRPNHSSGGVIVPILVMDNDANFPGVLTLLNDGTYGVLRQDDSDNTFDGAWSTTGARGLEPVLTKYNLLG